MISLDNNVSERALRRPVVTRKNAYGSRTGDAARLAARIWTVTAPARLTPARVGLTTASPLRTGHADYQHACDRAG